MALDKDKKQSPIALLYGRVAKLEEIVEGLQVIVAELQAAKPVPRVRSSINKTEEFNGEVEPEVRDSGMGHMGYEDRIQSCINAAKILPPNKIKNGRHSPEDIRALVGFPVSDEMMDDIYAKFSHEL